MFSPKKDYNYETEKIALEEFHHYKERFILRPAYQRKANIWPPEKRQSFLDSVCRGYYIPPLVLREVRISEDKVRHEVIDGQQRITTIQLFYDNLVELPKTLESMTRGDLLAGRRYEQLEVEQKRWFDKLYLEADVINNIDGKSNADHLRKASDIFWRLQLGEPLTFMERQHARVYSGTRNFVTKYADDTSYDFNNYEFLPQNPNRHPFFGKLLAMKNNRMQHLLLLSRLLLLEFNDGPTNLALQNIDEMFEKHSVKTMDDHSFENRDEAKRSLRLLNKFYEIFKDDPMVVKNSGVQELKVEYFILSLYLLLRHLDTYYVFGKDEYPIFQKFVSDFYQRWKKDDPEDTDLIRFRENRRQTKENIETRDMIIRVIFFNQHPNLLLKDSQRTFNEVQRIAIYRRDKGLCQMCLKEGKPPSEALVSWSDYNADHIVAHIKGGVTLPENAQVLCKYHNLQKGGK
jgi:hypothetical protein